MNEIRKSINSILYERTTSPFYGTLIISWLIWNWQIVYLTLFVSEDKISTDKISFIKENLCEVNYLLTFPIISTIVILTLIPFVSNGAYWLNMKFSQWKSDQKNKIEKKQLLTIEQSIELREQISKQEERFEKLLSDKNLKIKQLEQSLQEGLINLDQNGIPETDLRNELNDLAEKILSSDNMKSHYNNLVESIQGSWKVSLDKTPTNFLAMLEANDIIQNNSNGLYKWGENGKEFLKIMSKRID